MVVFDLAAGHLSDVIGVLRNKISSYQRGCVKFKVGITVNPEQRWSGAHKRSRHEWDKMVVIYETSSHDYVGRAESSLIEFSSEKYADKCQNLISGGGGINEPGDYGRFYLYILLKK